MARSRFLQFTLRLGSRSVLSTCKAPDQPGEGVLLHYSYDNGITWKLLEHYSYLSYHEPRYVRMHPCSISFLGESQFSFTVLQSARSYKILYILLLKWTIGKPNFLIYVSHWFWYFKEMYCYILRCASKEATLIFRKEIQPILLCCKLLEMIFIWHSFANTVKNIW